MKLSQIVCTINKIMANVIRISFLHKNLPEYQNRIKTFFSFKHTALKSYTI